MIKKREERKKKNIFHRQKIKLDKMGSIIFLFYHCLERGVSSFDKKKKLIFEYFLFFKISSLSFAIISCCQTKTFKHKKKKKFKIFFFQLCSNIPRWRWSFDPQHPILFSFCEEKEENFKKKSGNERKCQMVSLCQYCYWHFFQNCLPTICMIIINNLAVKSWKIEFLFSDKKKRKKKKKKEEIFISSLFCFRWIIPFFFHNVNLFAFHWHPALCFQFFQKKKKKQKVSSFQILFEKQYKFY